MVVHASVRMLIPSQKRDEVLGILGSLSRMTRYEPGCIRCRVYRGEEEEDGILLDELWSDEEQLERHLRSSEFYKVLLVSELSSAPPEFRFERVLHSSGIETIVKARSSAGAGDAISSTTSKEVSP
jgi:quinol monooxygenase YgiN